MNRNEDILVSVVMTTYRHEEFIAEAIEGVVNQRTNFNFELLIGEDLGGDRTREICKKYQEQYPDIIHLIFPDENLGGQDNFINLFNHTQGRYVAICEGDDYWIDNEKLQKQVDFLESHPDFSMCSTAAQRYYYERYWDVPVTNETLTTQDLLKEDWGIMTATIVFRKDMLQIPRWFKSVKNGDYSLQLLLSLKGNIGCLTDVTSIYRQHLGGISNSLTAFRQATWLIYLLSEFNKYTGEKFLPEIKNEIKRIYKNQLQFAKENKLRKAYWELIFFQSLSPIFPFLIKNFRK